MISISVMMHLASLIVFAVFGYFLVKFKQRHDLLRSLIQVNTRGESRTYVAWPARFVRQLGLALAVPVESDAGFRDLKPVRINMPKIARFCLNNQIQKIGIGPGQEIAFFVNKSKTADFDKLSIENVFGKNIAVRIEGVELAN